MYGLTTLGFRNKGYLLPVPTRPEKDIVNACSAEIIRPMNKDMKAKSTDEQGYELMFQQFYRFVYNSAFIFLKDEHETADLVQSFFIDLWEKQLYLELRENVKGYLYTAIRNRVLNHLRNKEAERRRYELFRLDFDPDPRPANNHEQYFLMVHEALENLPLKRRVAIEMVYLKDQKYQEAAQSMGISINTLKTHVKIGLHSLRNVMPIRSIDNVAERYSNN